MNDHFKPYPEYNDSGVPWLGQIPAHWKVLRAKNVFQVIDVRSETGAEELLTVSSSDGVVPRSQKNVTMFKAESYVGHKLCWPGDLVINSLWAWMQGLGFAKQHGLVSSAYGVYRPRSAFAEQWKYFDYLLRSAAYKWELVTRSKGVWLSRLQLSDPAFLDVPILVPPPVEEAAIVRYLDHIDRRIRRYIAAKRKLIALLNEQKQAIIHDAVTRGLDPSVRLKPSGVTWLEDVPEHWEVRRLKNLFTEIDDRSETGEETLLSLRMYQGLVPHNDVSNIPIESSSLKGFKRVVPGQVVMNRMRAAIGMFGVARQAGIVSPDYAVFEAGSKVDPYYFLHLFKTRAAGAIFRMESKGLGTGSSGFMRLYTDRFGIIKVALPGLAEQRAIVHGIAIQTAEIERTIKRVEREIDLIREYRTRLIADVVTGKLDVRSAAANLPDEIGVEEPLEEVLADEDAEMFADEDAVEETVE